MEIDCNDLEVLFEVNGYELRVRLISMGLSFF